MAKIYDETGEDLMAEWAPKKLKRGQYYTISEIVDMYMSAFPKFKPGSVKKRVYNMCVNSPGRDSRAKPGSVHDLFFKQCRNQYRLWEPEHDPAPIYNT